MYRKTYAEINLTNISSNVKKILTVYNEYKYYIGVVKANAYGHNGLKVINKIIDSGCNYLAVSSLDEAIKIRHYYKDIPILCLEPINLKFIKKCLIYNITITITSKTYLTELLKQDIKNIKIHIKIDSGMNRLGVNNKEEFNEIYNILKASNVCLEGIYSHIFWASNKEQTLNQFNKFKDIIGDINKEDIPIIHLGNSETLVNYPKLDYVNGVRLGLILYGFTNNTNLKLESTFSVISNIIEIKKVKKGDTVGYNGLYKAPNDILMGIIPIGYADGISRNNTGCHVFINDNKYKIIGNICMDMLMVKIDDHVKLNDKVFVIKDVDHINYIADYTNTIPYEILCMISNRVPRRYK